MFPQRNACIRNTPNTVWRRNISSRGTSGSDYRRKEWTGNEKDREKGGKRKGRKRETDEGKLSTVRFDEAGPAESFRSNINAVTYSKRRDRGLLLSYFSFFPFTFVTSFFEAFGCFPSKVTRKSAATAGTCL